MLFGHRYFNICNNLLRVKFFKQLSLVLLLLDELAVYLKILVELTVGYDNYNGDTRPCYLMHTPYIQSRVFGSFMHTIQWLHLES